MPPPPSTSRPKLLVADFVAQDVTPAQAAAFTDAAVQSLVERKLFEVLSNKDVRAIVSAERQRQLLGTCGDAAAESCLSNLGDTLGARYVMTGALSRLGGAYEVSVQVLDTVKGRQVGRSTRLASSLDVLRQQLPYAVSEASGAPLPPPPSRVLQYSMVAAGGASFLAGGMLGMLAVSRQGVLNQELCPSGKAGACGGTDLRTRDIYVTENDGIARSKTFGLVMMLGGAALAAGGLYLMPPPEGGPRVAIVPSDHGFAIAGVLP